MNYELDCLVSNRRDIYKFLRGLKGESFIQALDFIEDRVLAYAIRDEIRRYMDDKSIFEFTTKRFLSLAQEQQDDVINIVLERAEKELMPYKTKIFLLSKSEIKKALELGYKLKELYLDGKVKLELMKEQKMYLQLLTTSREETIFQSKVLNVELEIRTKMMTLSCRLLGFFDNCDSQKDIYEFILKKIDELNKRQNYFEFEFSKDEEV